MRDVSSSKVKQHQHRTAQYHADDDGCRQGLSDRGSDHAGILGLGKNGRNSGERDGMLVLFATLTSVCREAAFMTRRRRHLVVFKRRPPRGVLGPGRFVPRLSPERHSAHQTYLNL